MMSNLSEVTAFALVLPLAVVASQLLYQLWHRVRTYAVSRCVAQISKMVVETVEPSDEEMRTLRLRFPTGVVLESVLFIAERVYGKALNRLSLIVEVCEIDGYLQARIMRRRGDSRLGELAKLAALPNAAMVVECLSAFLEDGSRELRLHLLSALVAARPERAIRNIASGNDMLTLQEVAVLARLMHRAGAPIAYTPLLISKNRNLQLVGITMCARFSIVDAEPHLQRLVESEDESVSYFALQTLCLLRGNLSTSQVREAFARLQPHQRLSFLLNAVQNCYSLRSCAHLFTCEERTNFTHRVNSYKCRIICN